MGDFPIKIIVSEDLPSDTIMLVPTHPLTAEETERARVLMTAGWSEMEAIAEVRARQCAAIKCAASPL